FACVRLCTTPSAFPYTTLFRSSPLLDVPGGTEEAFGPLKGVGVKASGEHAAAGWRNRVVGAGQARDRIEQDDHVFAVLHAPFGLDRKSTRLNSSHDQISYAVLC